MGQLQLFGDDDDGWADEEDPLSPPPDSDRLGLIFRSESSGGIDPSPHVERFRFADGPEFREGIDLGAEARATRRRKKIPPPPLTGPRHEANLRRFESYIRACQAAGPYFRSLGRGD